MRRVHASRWLAIAVVAAVALGACGGGDDDTGGATGPSTGETSSGGTDPGDSGGPFDVVVATGNDLITLDPQAVQDYPGRVIYGNIFESLVRRDASGELVPGLAASMPTLVDPTTWEVKLVPGITWQDGAPLRAADVAYSINRVIDPNFRTQQATLFNTISGATAVDDTTVRITTRKPDPILATRLSLLLIIKENDAERPDFADNPIGTGPYKFVSRKPAGDTVIEKWADYREDLTGAPDTLTLRVMPEPRTRVAALESGEVDIVPALSPDDVELVPKAVDVASTETMLLRLDSRKGVLTDKRLRQAINLAINREELVDALFSGYGEPAKCQIAAPTVFGHDSSLAVPEYDPDAARALVEEAAPDGVTLTFTAPANRFAKGREVAQAVAQYLEEVGFTVELSFPSDQEMATQLLQPPRFPSIFMYSANSEFFDEAKELQWLTTDGQFSGASDPEIDALADQAEQEMDPTVREELFAQINQRACEDVSNAYIYVAKDIYGLSDAVEWTPRGDGLIVATEIKAA